ncbi:MAG: hypothetical protein H7A25_11225 [Leptospiraceae bacterium]|nr:hypothetical protein [Leptospiraceae bacterium]MCP5500467.1 hypothetical protein [Leptospiraceae bacterium]
MKQLLIIAYFFLFFLMCCMQPRPTRSKCRKGVLEFNFTNSVHEDKKDYIFGEQTDLVNLLLYIRCLERVKDYENKMNKGGFLFP